MEMVQTQTNLEPAEGQVTTFEQSVQTDVIKCVHRSSTYSSKQYSPYGCSLNPLSKGPSTHFHLLLISKVPTKWMHYFPYCLPQ